MNLSEQIEALQARWRKLGNDSRSVTRNNQPTPAGCSLLTAADQLAALLVAANEQETELGIAKTSMVASDCEAMRIHKELAALKEQHSADLREIAEMAIRWAMVTGKPSLSADEVLAAFHEKQQKAEVKAQ